MKSIKNLFGNKSSKSTTKKSKQEGSDTKKESAPEAAFEDERLTVAKAYLQSKNNRDMEASRKLLTSDFVTQFKEFEAELEDYARESQNLYDAFPDFNVKHTVDNPITLREDGVVVIDRIVPNGHHTGKPYSFGPCEPIEPKGTYVENSPETIYLHFRGDKIYKQEIVSHGEMTGPPGFYTQLGGFPLL